MSAAVGLSFRAESDPSRIEAISQAAARYSFPALSVWDDLGDPPPWPLLLALAERDRLARLGVACLAVPKYASLDGVVGVMAAVSQMRRGPVFIGLASGAWLDQVGLKGASVQQISEAAGVIQYLWRRETTGFEGRYYSVAPGFRLNFDTPAAVPGLMIGGWGERVLHLAGQIAEEVKLGGTAASDLAAIARARIEPGALAAGRDPRHIGVVLGAVTIVDTDGKAAMAEARRRAAPYIAVIGKHDPFAAQWFPDALDAIERAANAGHLELAAASVPDDLLRRFAFAGTPDDVIRQVEAALSAGATRVDFGSPHGLDPIGGIGLIGERVLPYFDA